MSAELDQMLQLLGEEATLKIVESYAGTRLFVPRSLASNSKLMDQLGEKDFSKLVEYFAGTAWINVPIAREWRLGIYLAMTPPLTTPEIARKLGCIENTVYRLKRESKRDRAQMVLPF